jgi:asparagine synthase (glutamine-hydrolysing)
MFHEKESQAGINILNRMVGELRINDKEKCIAKAYRNLAIGMQKCQNEIADIKEINVKGFVKILAFYGSVYNLNEFGNIKIDFCNSVESILECYVQKGIDFVKKIDGEFSFALFDEEINTLFLATDRFKIYPILFYNDAKKIVFASNLKCIKKCNLGLDLKINNEAVVDLIGTSIISAPKTIYKNIGKLSGGQFLKCRNRNITFSPYWDIKFIDNSTVNEQILAEEFRSLFLNAVQKCLKFDKDKNKVGSFLSGGVDSSTVSAVLTQLCGKPIKAFSIGFDVDKYNEINYADIAAKAFECEHYKYYVTPQDTYNAIDILSDVFDEPYGNASAISTLYCAKLALEKGVSVLYGGDGGDELFAGNERYLSQKIFDYYLNVPEHFRENFINRVVPLLADKFKLKILILAKKYIDRANIPYGERISSYDFFNIIPIDEFCDSDFLKEAGASYNPSNIFKEQFQNAAAISNLNKHLCVDWKLTLADNDLIKFKMASSVGVSVRFPYLDYKLVEFSTRIPVNLKMRGTKLRTFQKNSFKHILPKQILKKKKHGFGLPISIWLRQDRFLKEKMTELVLSHRSIQRGYFKKEALEKLIYLHSADTTPFYGSILWNLMVLEMWHRKHAN